MTMAFLGIVLGLALLTWSADRFVEGASATAGHLRVPPLLIGMVVVGFGTSAPELMVSALAAVQGNPGLALGNAYGSNITNIALILGLTALISPITVHSRVLRQELPILSLVTLLAVWQLTDGLISRTDALVLLLVFAGLMAWTITQGLRQRTDPLGGDMQQELQQHAMSPGRALTWLILGLILLVLSARILVWGAVEIARGLGVDDLIIGLTIVAVGTSLPELASSLAAARRGEHDLALGNILGSNLFNTLAVVGIAGSIGPVTAGPEVLYRDAVIMGLLTLSLFAIGYGRHGPGRISRPEGAALAACYLGYVVYLGFAALR
jgi:cation:H+ antiporter